MERRLRKDLKVLIVDDDEKSLKLMEAKLVTLGFRDFLKTDNGKECLFLARHEQPDIIFLDVMMPELDGGSVKRQLLDDIETKDIPVIFITAMITDEEIEKRGQEIGTNLYVAKPFDTEKIDKAIRAALGNI